MQDFLKNTIIEAGKIAKEYFDKGVQHTEKSGPADLLTEADIAVSDFLVGKIAEKYPDHHIASEEMAEDINPGAEYEWVIDPIDGTRNFAMGVSMWCQMVGVLKNGQIILGAVYNPCADELFFAEKGKGAYMNDEKIKVNGVDKLDHSFGMCVRSAKGKYEDKFRRFVSRVALETDVWMHNFGTMLTACYIASGGIDFMVDDAGYDHDYIAPLIICQEAGAIVTDSDGQPWQRGRMDCVIANPKLHPKVMELFD